MIIAGKCLPDNVVSIQILAGGSFIGLLQVRHRTYIKMGVIINRVRWISRYDRLVSVEQRFRLVAGI